MEKVQDLAVVVPRTVAKSPATDWPAIIAGAVLASAALLTLMAFGAAVGFATIGTWSWSSSATALGVVTVLWTAIAHLLAGGIGSYAAGRLRSEVGTMLGSQRQINDGLHGLAVWATTVVASTLIASLAVVAATLSVVEVGGRIAAAATHEVVRRGPQAAPSAEYWTDLILRANAEPFNAPGQAARVDHGEITRIIATGLATGDVPAADRDYIARMAAARTGLSAAEARTRVDDVLDQARKAISKVEAAARDVAETARKTAASAALWSALALVLMAGCCWYGARLGGTHRDRQSSA